MFRLTSWFAALAVFSLLVFGAASESQAAKKHRGAGKKTAKNDVKVTVLDASGNAVPGAKVHLRKATAKAKKAKRSHASVTSQPVAAKKPHSIHHAKGRSAVTDASGKANFAHVHAGRFHVAAAKSGLGSGRAHVKVKGGKVVSVTIHLHSNGKHNGKASAGKKHHAPVAPHSTSENSPAPTAADLRA